MKISILVALFLICTSCGYHSQSERMAWLQARDVEGSRVYPVPDESERFYIVVRPCGSVSYFSVDSYDFKKTYEVIISPCCDTSNK